MRWLLDLVTTTMLLHMYIQYIEHEPTEEVYEYIMSDIPVHGAVKCRM